MNRTLHAVSMLLLSALLTSASFSHEAFAQDVADTSTTEQEAPESATLFSGNLVLGGVAEVGAGVTSAYGLAHPTFHLAGSLVIDRRFFIGVMWQRTLGERNPPDEVDERLYYDMNLVGARLSYLWMAERVVPFGLSLGLGWGEVDADLLERFDSELAEESFGEENFFWAELAVTAHVRLIEHLHLKVEGGYRFAPGAEYRAASSADISGVFVRLSLVGGYFGRSPESP